MLQGVSELLQERDHWRRVRVVAWRWQWPLRVVGAALLAGMGWIHWELYDLGYSSVPTIGPLFLLNAVLGALAAAAVLVTPSRWLALVELGGALLSFGTLAALVTSATVGLFGFTETWDAPLIGRTLVVETVGVVVLLAAALLHRRRPAAAETGKDGRRAP